MGVVTLVQMEAIISNVLPSVQVFLSIALIVLILLQRSEAGVGGTFGGGDGGGFRVKRGAEKVLFNLTIVVAVLFAVSAFLALAF